MKLNNKVVLPDRNNINKLCRLSFCEHGDITIQDVGRIVDIIDDGYAIEFTKKFKTSPYLSEVQTNIIFGLAKDVVFI